MLVGYGHSSKLESFLNSIVQKIFNKISRIVNPELDKLSILIKLFFLNKKTIFLFGCPVHSNMGDQAQTYCILKWLKNNYTGYRIIRLSYITATPLALRLLRKNINKDDLIFGHSGYFMVDHHLELPIYRQLAKIFTDYKIVIFPQTINLKSSDVIEKTTRAFNSHSDFTLICRDEVSYASAQKLFFKCKLLLYPDVVTSLIGTKKFSNERSGILFCMRNDIEAYYKIGEINRLRKKFINIELTEISDTSIVMNYKKMLKERDALLEEMLNDFSRFKLVITDRYHGTIFSLIASTPVIVLSSADHKLSSGVKWFPKEFGDYIKYASNLDDAFCIAINMLKNTDKQPLSTFFQDNYFLKLKERL